MATWTTTDGAIVNLKPSRILVIDGEAHAFGRLDAPGWPQFRLSSPAIEITERDGTTHIRTRSRTYVCAGQNAPLPLGAGAQMKEFLYAWKVPAEQWQAILDQLGAEE